MDSMLGKGVAIVPFVGTSNWGLAMGLATGLAMELYKPHC